MPGRTKPQLVSILHIIAATALVGSVFAGEPLFGQPGPAMQSQPNVCKVSGVVKNSVTGEPIERALVDGQWDAALTDGEGRFELHLFCPGQTQLSVRRPGYSNLRGSSAVSVRVEPDAPEVTLTLTPQSTITGHVSVSNGGDASDIYFQAYKASYSQGHLRWNFAVQAKTDSNGTFRMNEVEAPGKYLLCSQQVQEHPEVSAEGKVIYGYPTTCYPPVSGTDSEGLLQLTPGQQAEIEISITRQPLYPVYISERVPMGQRQGLTLYSQNGAPVNASLRWKDGDQSWEALLPNGTYFAESRSWGASPAYGRVDFKVANTGVSGLRMSVVPLAPVEVVVHKVFTAQNNEQSSQVAVFHRVIGSEQTTEDANAGLAMELVPVEPRLDNSGGAGVGLQHQEGDPPGHFEALGLSPGRYWVQAFYYSGGYISAMNSGATDLMREPLVIGPGNSVAPIEVTVRNDGGAIDCTLPNAPKADAQSGSGMIRGYYGGFSPDASQVYAIPSGSRFSRVPNSPINFNGTARIESLAPGLYRVFALKKFEDLNSADPAELASLLAQAKIVRVEPGSSTSVQVDFAKPDEEPTQ